MQETDLIENAGSQRQPSGRRENRRRFFRFAFWFAFGWGSELFRGVVYISCRGAGSNLDRRFWREGPWISESQRIFEFKNQNQGLSVPACFSFGYFHISCETLINLHVVKPVTVFFSIFPFR